MTLTEALHICQMMHPDTVRDTLKSESCAPMLRTVCEWRLNVPLKYAELVRLTELPSPALSRYSRGIDESGMPERIKFLLSSKAMRVEELVKQCHVTPSNVYMIVNRLRASGVNVVYIKSKGRAGTYHIEPVGVARSA